jgi:hypothetical protein
MSPLQVGTPAVITGVIKRDGTPVSNYSFGVHDGIRLQSYIASTDSSGNFRIQSTPVQAAAALLEINVGGEWFGYSFDVIAGSAPLRSLLCQNLALYNTSSRRMRAVVTSPYSNRLEYDVAPGQTINVVKMSGPRFVLKPTVQSGVTTIWGLGALGGDASYTVNTDGLGQATVTVGAAGLLRFSVYSTSQLDAGLCWSPGGDIGAGGGGSLGGSLCLGSDGISIGGDLGYGVLTSGFSIQLIEW